MLALLREPSAAGVAPGFAETGDPFWTRRGVSSTRRRKSVLFIMLSASTACSRRAQLFYVVRSTCKFISRNVVDALGRSCRMLETLHRDSW